MPGETIIARLRLEGQRQFSRDAQEASKDVRGIGTAADETTKKSETMGTKGGQGMERLKLAAKRTGMVVGAAGAAATVMGIKYNAANEMATVSFRGLLGSQAKAEDMMSRIQKFAAKTPFEQAQLTAAAQRWVGVGNTAKSVIPSMRAVGDAVAAVGGAPEDVMGVVTALTQMQNKGKASSEELQQIAERNIPAFRILGKQMGLTGAELTDKLAKGQIKAGDAVKALVTGMEKTYKGSMASQSKTFTGMMSTIKDNFNMILGTATKPLFTWLQTKVLPVIIRITNALVKAGQQGGFKGLMEAIGKAVPAMGGLPGIISGIAKGFRDAGAQARGFNWVAVFTALSAAASPFAHVLFYIVGLIGKIMALPGAPQLLGALLAMAAAAAVANKLTGGLLGSLTKMGIASIQLANNLVGLVTQILAYRTARMLATGADEAAMGAQKTQAALATANNADMGMGTLQLVRYRIAQLASATASKAQAAATWVMNAAQRALNATMAMNPIALIVIALVALGVAFYVAYKKSETFRNIVNGALRAVWGVIKSVWGWIKGHWPLLLTILGGPFGAAVVVIIKHFDQIKKGVTSVWTHIKSIFGKVKGFIGSVFSGEFISGIGRGLANWLNANTPFGDRVEFSVLGKHVGFTIPALAEGGSIMKGGTALVGERGPELLSLPQAAVVQPLAQGGGTFVIEVPVYLDRRQIAHATGQYNADQAARKGVA